MKPVAIIGGGITGLTAAFRLQQLGVPVTLYEAASRVGGVIQSVHRDGFLAECGPNTILETSPKISSVIHDLGLDGRKLESDPAAKDRYLVRNGRLVCLPDSIPAFLRTRLFSARAKLRLLAEPFIAPAAPGVEESVAQFVSRRLGREFLDYAINPLVGGVYAGDPAKLSVKHAFPKLYSLEQRYRSLILGQVLGARERRHRAEVSKQNARKISFDGGLQVLTDELRLRLGQSVRLRAPVGYVRQIQGGWRVFARVDGAEASDDFGAVLFAGTSRKLAQLTIAADNAPDLRTLEEVYYPPVASVVLGFDRDEVLHPLKGFGVLIPEVEGFQILGTIFSSSLFGGRAPAGHVLLTSYLGGARNPGLALADPAVQVEAVRRDLRKLVGVSGRPTFVHLHVFPKAIPQYEVGYGRFKNLMNEMESKCSGFFLAGHYRDGISLGDSIVSGHDAAARVHGLLVQGGTRDRASEGRLERAA